MTEINSTKKQIIGTIVLLILAFLPTILFVIIPWCFGYQKRLENWFFNSSSFAESFLFFTSIILGIAGWVGVAFAYAFYFIPTCGCG